MFLPQDDDDDDNDDNDDNDINGDLFFNFEGGWGILGLLILGLCDRVIGAFWDWGISNWVQCNQDFLVFFVAVFRFLFCCCFHKF